jgi:hypothetical protein
MADVAIIHAADKATAATRLAESIVAAGYDVSAVEIEEPDRLADAVDACAADARILIWSRPLVSHVLHSGELPRIRQLPNLIEVSADGITPPSRGDDSRVVLISGWRGQPFHPGWQRILIELKRLCGTRKTLAETPRAVAPPANSLPHPAAQPAPGGAPRAPSRLILGGTIAVLLVGAAVGAASWLSGRAPDNRPRPELTPARQPEPTIEAPPRMLPAPGAASAVEKEPAAASPALPSKSTVPAKTEAERPQAERAVRSAPPEAAGGGKDRTAPKAGSSKKYSPRYSKVMRQFCERSGRSTPQCRTFLRSTRPD